jgi:hypothetical protein
VPCVSQFPDKYTLDIFAVGSDSLLSDLKCLAAKTSNVFVREPLNFQDIISSLSSYDLGIAFIRPSTTNLRKLFEYIQASLPVLTGPTPDIVKIVSSWKIGFVADSFSTCAFHRSLQFIDLAMVKAAKKNTFHAKDILCWEYESKILDRLISS